MLSNAAKCVRRYPINALVTKHMSSRGPSCLRFSGFSVFFGFCIFVSLCVFIVLVGERFYEGLISILNSGVCLGR